MYFKKNTEDFKPQKVFDIGICLGGEDLTPYGKGRRISTSHLNFVMGCFPDRMVECKLEGL